MGKHLARDALPPFVRMDDLDSEGGGFADVLALIGLIRKAVGQERPEPMGRPQQGLT